MKVLSNKEIEKELEELFGFPDGTISEDDGETSEIDDLEQLLSTNRNDNLVVSDALSETIPTPLSPHEPQRSSPQPGCSHQELTHRNNRLYSVSPQPTQTLSRQRRLASSSSESDDSDIDEDDWKKQDWSQSPNISVFDAISIAPQRNIANRTKPIVYFEMFFDTVAIDIIVNQTNLYASQCNDQNFAPTSVAEIKAVLGMIIQMGLHRLPNIEDYWSSDPLMQVVEIAETMPLKRFQKIMKYLHINDNTNMPSRDDDNYDKLFKIRPLLDHMNKLFQTKAKITNSQSIDECMIKFKGRSSLNQYMPLKPIKRGFKVWARADSESGYLYEFQVYTGKGEDVETGLGANVVKTLCRTLINDSWHGHVTFDNFFCSPGLIQELYNDGIYATGTVRCDRQDMPLLVKKPKATGDKKFHAMKAKVAEEKNKEVKKLKRGQWKWRVKNNVGFVVWKDSKLVTILSSAFHPNNKTSCDRTQKDTSKATFACPLSVKEYTRRMGGVDRFDHRRATYAVGRKSKKWWKRIFYFLIDAAITNAFILYTTNTRNHNDMTQKEFRIVLSRELVANNTFRKKSFVSLPKFASKKRNSLESETRQKKLRGVPEEVRYSDLGYHWPNELPNYRRCRLCSSKENNKRSKVQCSRCQVPLCSVPCFHNYHQIQE